MPVAQAGHNPFSRLGCPKCDPYSAEHACCRSINKLRCSLRIPGAMAGTWRAEDRTPGSKEGVPAESQKEASVACMIQEGDDNTLPLLTCRRMKPIKHNRQVCPTSRSLLKWLGKEPYLEIYLANMTSKQEK